jgi:hypothetical protein
VSNYSFTVTQAVSNFTATLTIPLNLALTNVPNTVRVTETSNQITVNNVIQPVTILGGGAANYNQSLNSGDNVSFASVRTTAIYGTGNQPVAFPNGVDIANFGLLVTTTGVDFGPIV